MTTAAPSALVTERMDSLHTLGTDISEADNAFAGLARAGLTGWNVRTIDTYTVDGVKVPGGRASVADIEGKRKIFGAVGSTYTPVQNEAFAGLLDKLSNESGAELSVGMSTLGGSRVLVSMTMPETLMLGGIDPHSVNLVALINHRTGANRLSAIPFRAFCANQNPQIIRDGDELFTLRHTSGANVKMDRAGEMLSSVSDYLGEFRKTSEAMMAAPMSEAEFLTTAAKLLGGSNKSKAGETRSDNRLQLVRRIFVQDKTNENIRFTRWGGYQSILEYVDHMQGTRQRKNSEGDEGPKTSPAERRAMRALTGGAASLKLKALDAFSVS